MAGGDFPGEILEQAPGLLLPRLETPHHGGPSWGSQVAAWSERVLGVPLFPWQVHALEGLLIHDGQDHQHLGHTVGPRLAHRTGLISVARQNGKTVLVRSLVGWWLTELALLRGRPQEVITTAHRLDLATALFSELAPVLEAQFGAKAKWSFGRTELTMPDGSQWLVQASSPSAGHGRRPSLVVCDEVWGIAPEVIDQGLMPAQRAQFSPLLVMFSTAGDESSTAMIRWRDAGIAAIEKGQPTPNYLCEWSPPPDAAVLSRPDLWAMANPSLGYTLDMDTLRQEAESPNRSAFLRANLNMWVAAAKGWLEAGMWDAARWNGKPLTGLAPAVLAVECSQDASRYVGVWAWQVDDCVVVGTAFTAASEAEMWQQVERLLPARGCQLLLGESLDLHCPGPLKTRRQLVRWYDLRKWTSPVRLMIAEGRLYHLGDMALTEHVTRAVATYTGQTSMLSSNASPGPIELARAMVWAAATASKPVRGGKPMVVSTAPR